MAPSVQESKPTYTKDERPLCFHGELLYEAKVLDLRRTDPKDKSSPFEYKVHYKGWKNTWDDWVPQSRLRKNTDENRELALNLRKATQEQNQARRPPPAVAKGGRKRAGSDIDSGRGSIARDSSVSVPKGKRKGDNDIEKEESFTTRPSIHLPLPDHLKNLLVDDWENITKSHMLVPLPSPHPVNAIIAQYHETQSLSRTQADRDILDEFCAGLRLYFAKSITKILLYRAERGQLAQVRKWWETPVSKEWEGKGPGDCYGAEHLARLLVSMPELIAQTNMDRESVAKLKEELTGFAVWLSRESGRLFCASYEKREAEA